MNVKVYNEGIYSVPCYSTNNFSGYSLYIVPDFFAAIRMDGATWYMAFYANSLYAKSVGGKYLTVYKNGQKFYAGAVFYKVSRSISGNVSTTINSVFDATISYSIRGGRGGSGSGGGGGLGASRSTRAACTYYGTTYYDRASGGSGGGGESGYIASAPSTLTGSFTASNGQSIQLIVGAGGSGGIGVTKNINGNSGGTGGTSYVRRDGSNIRTAGGTTGGDYGRRGGSASGLTRGVGGSGGAGVDGAYGTSGSWYEAKCSVPYSNGSSTYNPPGGAGGAYTGAGNGGRGGNGESANGLGLNDLIGTGQGGSTGTAGACSATITEIRELVSV